MSSANAAIARRWFEEVWNQRRTETIFELSAPAGLGATEFGPVADAQAFLDLVYLPFVTGFPDLRVDVEDVVSERDQAVVRWRAIGTHTGDVLGVPATGKRVSFRGVTWLGLRAGKLAQCWDSWNAHGLLQTLQGGPPAASVTLL
ncbi:ester cyclase [Frigoriglobus tundricola]|uniref:Ester cyclase n=1 Tax=Frigoriglobus tundricola TaxID=2774151 RepID=A0A6M5YVD6_9BACT|nr:ester cyclase [Frigoriglobus tundricola]QJW97460.1 hypothetical protein FTUN_5034 [Frigoriglobus tundricola]